MMSMTAAIMVMSLLAREREQAVSFLRDVEAATAELRDFRAGVVVDRVDALTEESERRMGRVLLEIPATREDGAAGAAPEASARSASRAPASGSRIVLVLDTFIGADGRADESRRVFIYDGGWFAEIDHDRRQFVNRQIVPPGEDFDPLRVGEGPLPIPIGQRTDDVVRHFDVQPVTPPESGLLRTLEGVRGVRLTPRAGRPEAQETESVDLFYDGASFLPRGVIQRRVNGDRVEVLLRAPAMNGGLTDEERALFSIETPDPRDGWAVDVRPWKRRDDRPVGTEVRE